MGSANVTGWPPSWVIWPNLMVFALTLCDVMLTFLGGGGLCGFRHILSASFFPSVCVWRQKYTVRFWSAVPFHPWLSSWHPCPTQMSVTPSCQRHFSGTLTVGSINKHSDVGTPWRCLWLKDVCGNVIVLWIGGGVTANLICHPSFRIPDRQFQITIGFGYQEAHTPASGGHPVPVRHPLHREAVF